MIAFSPAGQESGSGARCALDVIACSSSRLKRGPSRCGYGRIHLVGYESLRRGIRDRSADVGAELPALLQRFCYAEVENLALAGSRDHQVRRLQVRMDDSKGLAFDDAGKSVRLFKKAA
jgi:hypothetical protein